ncbi:hypothetical protein V6N13_043123 [Hibiscus sabdariffa]|uniref:NAC domain-containing protein n=1 Tax=Hibiscus sabdariffa TaxID=183260 RepID=A0ABR2G3L5_9ROSI
MMNKDQYEAYLKTLLPGVRFAPRDDELVGFYLMRKVLNQPLPPNCINDVLLYNYHPRTLTANGGNMSSPNGVAKEWYFFTPKDRKYHHSNRSTRGPGDGFWKTTGVDKPVKSSGKVIGWKKTLVFHQRKSGRKTNWMMHEYTLSNPWQRIDKNETQLENWELCRVYKRKKDRNQSPQLEISLLEADFGLLNN